MQYKPGSNEITDLPSWDQTSRMQYFLSRAIECEEVWSLGDSAGWLLAERGNTISVPVWPYEELARLNLPANSPPQSPSATSLDHFIRHVLPLMQQQHIDLEILPMPGAPGSFIPADRLYATLDSMLESGEYFLEG